MQHNTIWSMFLSSALFVLGSSMIRADQETPKEGRAVELVRLLGSDSFEERESANEELKKLGKTASNALRAGLASDDKEVIHRCQQLLEWLNRSKMEVALDAFLIDGDSKHLFAVPSWSQFSKMVGTDKSARQLFVEMCCTEGSLLSMAENSPAKVATQLGPHCQELQQSLYSPTGVRGTISSGQVAALLFLTADKRINPPQQALYQVTSFLHQPGPKATFERHAGARRLLLKFIERHNSPTMVHQCMNIIQQFKLHEAVDLVLRVAQDKKQSGYVRANALISLGRMEKKEHASKMKAMLDDTSQVTRLTLNDMTIQVQLRDVALAMMILLKGDNLTDYPFPYLQKIQPNRFGNPTGYYYSPHYLGFQNDKQRKKAFAMFESRHNKKETKN